MSESYCYSCKGLIAESGKSYMYAGKFCDCPYPTDVVQPLIRPTDNPFSMANAHVNKLREENAALKERVRELEEQIARKGEG